MFAVSGRFRDTWRLSRSDLTTPGALAIFSIIPETILATWAFAWTDPDRQEIVGVTSDRERLRNLLVTSTAQRIGAYDVRLF
jgi:hypothetical protein